MSLMLIFTKISFKIAPSSIVFSNSVLMKSSQAGGSSVLRNRRKVRYWRISNMEINAPVIEGMLNKLVAKLAMTPAAADTKNSPATMKSD